VVKRRAPSPPLSIAVLLHAGIEFVGVEPLPAVKQASPPCCHWFGSVTEFVNVSPSRALTAAAGFDYEKITPIPIDAINKIDMINAETEDTFI
jgi:hypothetical protein